jgi:penicillin-binding protein 1A
MRGIREFSSAGFPRVQGGHFPALIWNAFMEPAHGFVPIEDWELPPPPERPNARLILPGSECVVTVVGYTEVPGAPVEPEVPAEAAPAAPAGILRAPPPPVDPGAPADPDAPPETAPPIRIPITRSVQVGTTIPPDVLDPYAPLPMVAISARVGPC